jgi:membrane fusion protein, copper/silver efflux system
MVHLSRPALSGIVAAVAALSAPSLIAVAAAPFGVSAAVAAEDPILFYRSPMGATQLSKAPKKDSMGMDFLPVRRSTVVALLGRLPAKSANTSEEPLFWHDSMGMGEISTTQKKDSMGMEMLPVRPSDIAGLLPPR